MALQYVDIFGNPLDIDWTTFTPENSFIQDATSPLAFKSKDGKVYIAGRVTRAEDTTNKITYGQSLVICTLPSTYAPKKYIRKSTKAGFLSEVGGNYKNVSLDMDIFINTGGQIHLYNSYTNVVNDNAAATYSYLTQLPIDKINYLDIYLEYIL